MAGRGGDGGGGRGYENLCPEFVGVRIVLYDFGGGRNLLFPFKIKSEYLAHTNYRGILIIGGFTQKIVSHSAE